MRNVCGVEQPGESSPKFLRRAYTEAIRVGSNSYAPRRIYAAKESTHAHVGFDNRICVCLFGDRPRPVDQSVVTDACLSFDEQSVRIWKSYVSGACPPSNSYGVEVQFPGIMKWSPHSSSPTRDFAAPRTHQWSRPADPQATSGFPQPGAVLFEIGVLLGVHLALALAVTLILRASGIV
jgi:hypothetical protein